MDREGVFSPETVGEVRQYYEAVGPAAQTVVREITRGMSFDSAEYDRRVDGAVVERARDALFASLLEVHVGTTTEFDAWRETHPAYDVTQTGSVNVDNVAWHVAPTTDTVVATTFQEERGAAVATLRRQAWGEIYRDLVEQAQ
jgi:hypothetical protein